MDADRGCRAVAAALDEARAGRGRVVVVEGVAGGGKTRLLDRAAAEAVARGLLVLRGRAEALDPHRLTTDLADIAATLAGTSDTGAGRSNDAAQPALVALDDLGGCRGADARAVGDLAQRLSRAGPVAVVLATRPPADGGDLASALADLERRGATRTALAALSPAATAGLARDLADARRPRHGRRHGPGAGCGAGGHDLPGGDARLTHPAGTGLPGADIGLGPRLAARLAAAGGNPGLVTELVVGLDAEGLLRRRDGRVELAASPGGGHHLPPGVRAWVRDRMAELPGPTRHALRMAALLGDRFRPGDLARVLGTDPSTSWSTWRRRSPPAWPTPATPAPPRSSTASCARCWPTGCRRPCAPPPAAPSPTRSPAPAAPSTAWRPTWHSAPSGVT